MQKVNQQFRKAILTIDGFSQSTMLKPYKSQSSVISTWILPSHIATRAARGLPSHSCGISPIVSAYTGQGETWILESELSDSGH
jgi:hypothetical protein